MTATYTSSKWVAFMLLVNLGLVVAHVGVFTFTGSHLVLAQGADSLMDVAVTAILAFTARVGAQPEDANHPFGHGRAEPIGALISAVLACVLTLEVARSAVAAALAHEVPALDTSVLAVLGAKFVAKSAFLAVLARRANQTKSPAVDAIVSDSRNDLAATAASTLGYFAIRAGIPHADTVFALAICLYIARNGLVLFRENLRYLMGEAPPVEISDQLRSAALAVAGVHAVGNIAAHYVGSQLHVEIAVIVDAQLSSTQSHDVGERVQHAVEAAADVGRAFVHVDTLERPRGP
jgi:cation diffusion facilitator family transporter